MPRRIALPALNTDSGARNAPQPFDRALVIVTSAMTPKDCVAPLGVAFFPRGPDVGGHALANDHPRRLRASSNEATSLPKVR